MGKDGLHRIAAALGSTIALVAVALPVTPARAVSARAPEPSAHVLRDGTVASLRGATTLDVATHARRATVVTVSWKWVKAASGYRIQLSRRRAFSVVSAVKQQRNSSRRPPDGRERTVVRDLHDATYYWVRVRTVRGHQRSRWTSPMRIATQAHRPDKLSGAHGVIGNGNAPGETTLRWSTRGGYTDFFRITTALTPFGSSRTPAVGRHSMTLTVPGDRRSLTLTRAQTAAAGAGIGTGRFLFFRISAVRKGEAGSATRRYPFLLHSGVAGTPAKGRGGKLRVMQYNVHVASKDRPGHPWKKRQYLVARSIAKVGPDVGAIQELMPRMWTDRAGGVGLDAALKQAGAGRYELTRTTAYWKDSGQDSRILYDPTKVTLMSSCPSVRPSCFIMLPGPKKHVAAYAEFRDVASGQAFYFVSAHLTAGNDSETDRLRGRQAKALSQGIEAINPQGLPVILGTDANSSQTSAGSDSPHRVLLNEGWYNCLSAARVTHGQYNTVNHYQKRTRSPYGFGSMYDSIESLGMTGADAWKQLVTGSPWPSDHNMIYADLRLP